VSRALIGFAESEARRRGHAILRLYTHALMDTNIALDSRVGFVEIARRQEQGFDRVYREKRLS